MNLEDKAKTIERYKARLLKYGESAKTMGWRNKKQQELRFRILSQIGDLSSKKILDVGCGFADFYKYLVKNNIKVKYTGYDISPDIIEVTSKLGLGINLQIKDILTDEIKEKFEYIFSSGVFNHHISNNLSFTKNMISKMFNLSITGIAVNMMTNYVDFKEEYLYYYSPEKMFEFTKSLTRYVVLRHDYPLYEFTLYLYHNPPLIK